MQLAGSRNSTTQDTVRPIENERAVRAASQHPSRLLCVKQSNLAALLFYGAFCALITMMAVNMASAEETGNPAAPEQKWLNTEQIETYLAGFFIKGVFHGTKWSSFFSPAGSTTYLAESRPPSYGEWKAENNRYCSQWPPSGGWDCYKISADGNNMTFVPLDGGDPWPGVRSKE